MLDEDVVDGHCKSYTGVLDSCVHTGDCGIRPVIVGLHEIVEHALSGITLAQLVGYGARGRHDAPPDSGAAAPGAAQAGERA